MIELMFFVLGFCAGWVICAALVVRRLKIKGLFVKYMEPLNRP